MNERIMNASGQLTAFTTSVYAPLLLLSPTICYYLPLLSNCIKLCISEEEAKAKAKAQAKEQNGPTQYNGPKVNLVLALAPVTLALRLSTLRIGPKKGMLFHYAIIYAKQNDFNVNDRS